MPPVPNKYPPCYRVSSPLKTPPGRPRTAAAAGVSMPNGMTGGPTYATQREHMNTWLEESPTAAGARFKCKECSHTWKHIDQTAMVNHFNDIHSAKILRKDEYPGRKKRKLGSPPKTACTASDAIAVTPGGNGKGTTTASDQVHTFARPSARDKTDTDLVNIFVSTLKTFDQQMLQTLAAMKAARNPAP